MKKLSLKSLKLEATDMLQRNQLKTVFGGYGGSLPASCNVKCSDTVTKTCYGTQCSAVQFQYCKAKKADGTYDEKKC